jgi:hypothetical protein
MSVSIGVTGHVSIGVTGSPVRLRHHFKLCGANLACRRPPRLGVILKIRLKVGGTLEDFDLNVGS